MQASPSRTVAFDVLRRVHEGAFAADLLLAKSKDLDSRDAGLASEIVFGCLRYQLQLDNLIGRLSSIASLDIEVRTALRMGIYQLRYLERIPAHAAVTECVAAATGCDASKIRIHIARGDPNRWGIGGVPASVLRAAEIAARAQNAA